MKSQFSIAVLALAFVVCTFHYTAIVSAYPQPLNQKYEGNNNEDQQSEPVEFQLAQHSQSEQPPQNQILPIEEDDCLQEKTTGPCRAFIPNYYFNQGTGKCQLFIYGGCEGNGNRFENFKECEHKCSKHLRLNNNNELRSASASIVVQGGQDNLVSSESICSLPHSEGPSCKAYIPRWTFDSTLKKCVQFMYKGCGATKNNFVNKASCEQTCENVQQTTQQLENLKEQRQPACFLPLERGPCFGTHEHYFFNSQNNRCEKFNYGGCDGNQNRFKTAQECQRACGGDEPTTDSACTDVQCPWNRYTHYTAMNCRPVYDGNACCPTRFDCPDTNLTNTSSSCHYRGKEYIIGQTVEEASDTKSCRAGCICIENGGKGRITCANMECPEQLGAVPPGKEGCRRLYSRDSCCATDYYCPPDSTENTEEGTPVKGEPTTTTTSVPVTSTTTPATTCEYEGKSYVEGERIYPTSAKCKRCLCQKGWNGTLSEEFCDKVDCGIEIYYADKLERGCAPVYFQDAEGNDNCCPISWQCPDEQQMVLPVLPTGGQNSGIPPVPVIQDQGPVNTILPIGEPIIEDNGSGNGPVNTILPIGEPIIEDNGTINTILPIREPIIEDNGPINTILPIGEPIIEDRNRDLSLVDNSACNQPKLTGPCRARRTRFYYNTETKKCESFVYGGCKGNQNNFVAQSDCQLVCENGMAIMAAGNTTDEDAAEGTTKTLLTRSRSSTVQQASNPTVYKLTETDPCEEPKLIGPCRAFIPRFYFSPEDNTCKFFAYGGCKGNLNNFYTKTSCEALCQNRLPVQSLRFNDEEGTKLTFEGTTTTVVRPADRPTDFKIVDVSSSSPDDQDNDGGQGQGQRDVCLLAPETGRCKGFIKKFYYDQASGHCKHFVYGGCGGNGNNFESPEECTQKCSNVIQEYGRGLNSDSDTTIRTRSRVADVNNNWRSKTRQTTLPTTGDQEPTAIIQYSGTERCYLPRKTGSCYALMKSYYYDVVSRKCEEFIYGGCFGNTNRFPTVEECKVTCEVPLSAGRQHQQQSLGRTGSQSATQQQSTNNEEAGASLTATRGIVDKVFCSLPPEAGPCKAAPQLRYFWSQETQTCLPFYYNGCGGNSNNFHKESDCISTCSDNGPTLENLARNSAVLSCTFGNETLEYGSTYGQFTSVGFVKREVESPCGVPVCSCQTPPALTCIQRACPRPRPTISKQQRWRSMPNTQEAEAADEMQPMESSPQLGRSSIRRPPPCPQPSCAPHCTRAVSRETGCPVCDCGNSNRPWPTFEVTHVVMDSSSGS